MENQNNKYQKRRSQTRTIYSVLAAAVVVITAMSAISGITKDKKPGTPENASTQESAPVTEEKDVIASVTEKLPESEATTVTEKDVMAEPEVTEDGGTTHTGTEAADATEEEIPVFVSPADGLVIKGHSGDTPVFSLTMNDYRPHVGVDIALPEGGSVMAAADGVITGIYEDPMAGNCMTVEHSGGYVTLYGNLSPLLPEKISVGSAVMAGQTIGTAGGTSLLEISEENHLHFEMYRDGVVCDPAEYISFTFADTEYEG